MKKLKELTNPDLIPSCKTNNPCLIAIKTAMGFVLRERNRLANIFEKHGYTEISKDILDHKDDEDVFSRKSKKQIEEKEGLGE